MDHGRLCRLFTAVLVLSLFVPACYAQDVDEDDEGGSTSASVTLQLDKQGNANVTIYSYKKVEDWTPIGAAASAALQCPVTNFAHPHTDSRTLQYASRLSGQERARFIASLEDANLMQMTAKCPHVMQHSGLMASQ